MITTRRKIGQLWARRICTVEICLQFRECVLKVTSFKDWLEYPSGVCDCLDSIEDKSRVGNGCAKLHSATRWERSAGVCVCVRMCVQILGIFLVLWRTCCYLYFLSLSSSASSLTSCVSFVFAPLFLLLSCIFLLSSFTKKCYLSSSTSVSHRHDLHFLFLLLSVCHKL